MIENYNGNKFAFDAIKIGMASPEQIREWSYGEAPSLIKTMKNISILCFCF